MALPVLQIVDTSTLLEALRSGAKLQYLLFWGHRAPDPAAIGKWCLSQWWPANFRVHGLTYPTAEHFMMAEKARLFGDSRSCQRILEAPDAAAAKKAGRGVRGFAEEVWATHRYDIVVRGSAAKFGQNPALRAFLLSTGDKILVEASPVDAVWGIGLAGGDPRALRPDQWRGLNLLGFALMRVRGELRSEDKDTRVRPGMPGAVD